MKYRVEPAIVEGCDCDDCKAGRHLYRLYRIPATGQKWSGMSLQAYASAEECKRKHNWGIEFGPDATWEDGAPVVEPESVREPHPDGGQASAGGMVKLDGKALQKSGEMLEKHWR